MITCPCCGSQIDDPSIAMEHLAGVALTPSQREILQIIVKSHPRPVSTDAMIDLIYGDDPEGGPPFVRNVIAQQISRIRPVVRKYGWMIPTSRSGQGRAGLYRLEKINMVAKETRP